MPIDLEIVRDLDFDELPVHPNTNEGHVLKLIKDMDTPVTRGDIVAEANLTESQVSGALSRLKKKDLLDYDRGDGYRLASDEVGKLADALIPTEGLAP